jgi:thiamine transporter ThiT
MEIAVRSTSRAVTGMRVGTGPLLVSLVAVSSVVHVLAAWLRATPVYFSDEYMYAELGRSFAESGLPLLRGELAPFPALVYPLLTAPAWLLGDVETSWRVLQAFGAVAMSLACIPVFLLARRLGLSRGLALALGALAIAVPDMVYAGWLLAETVAYPLALAAVAAGVFALASPTRRAQLAFLALAAAATGTRTQFAALFVVYPVAVGILAVAERRFRAVAREQLFPLAAVGIVGVGAFAAGPARVLGMYSSVLTVDVDAGLLVGRIGSNVLVLGYASAWILIPGAILGFGLALARPRTRVERAFAAVTVPFGATLVVEASLFATPEHVQERYAFYALPLLGLAFGLYASRGWPLRIVHAGLAAALLSVTAGFPLSGYTPGDGKTHSAFLLATGRLEQLVGDAAGAALLAAALAGAGLLAAIAASTRPKAGTPFVLAIALTFSGFAAAAATSFDLRNTDAISAAMLPRDPSWVDRAVDGSVTLLRTPGGARTETLEQLFWNPSVERVALLPDTVRLDAFQADDVRIGPDGALGVDHALLVETRGSWVQLRGVQPLASTGGYALWEPDGRPRLALLLAGRYADGWLAPSGRITVWPERAGESVAGRLRIELSAPDAVREMTFSFLSPGRGSVEAVVPGGATRVVTLTVCSSAAWRARFGADQAGFVGSRLVSGRASPPVFIPDAAACKASKPAPMTL